MNRICLRVFFRRVFPAALLGGLLVLAALPSDAQVLYGSIVGNVRDATGAALPGATVTITHEETKRVRETITDPSGAYRFPTVQAGTWNVVIAMAGFQTHITVSTITGVICSTSSHG